MKSGITDEKHFDGIPDFIKKSRNHYWNIYQFLIDFVAKKIESEQCIISKFNMSEMQSLEAMLSFERKESNRSNNPRIEYSGGRQSQGEGAGVARGPDAIELQPGASGAAGEGREPRGEPKGRVRRKLSKGHSRQVPQGKRSSSGLVTKGIKNNLQTALMDSFRLSKVEIDQIRDSQNKKMFGFLGF
jgi:hypothetical protein